MYRNTSLELSNKGPFVDIPNNVLSICRQAFELYDIPANLNPIEFIPHNFRKYGVRQTPSLYAWVEVLTPDANLTGAQKSNKQRVGERYLVKVFYLLDDLDNADLSENLGLVGYALYTELLKNSNLNDYMNADSRILAAYPTAEPIKTNSTVKIVDAFCIEVLYSKVGTSTLSSRNN